MVVTDRSGDFRRQRSPVPAFDEDVATDCRQRLAGDRFGADRSAVDRAYIEVLYRSLPDKTIRVEFGYYQCDAGAGNHIDRLPGGDQLASAVPRLSVPACFDRLVVLSEKEYRSPTRPRNDFFEKQNNPDRSFIRETGHTDQAFDADHGILRAGHLSGDHCQLQPAFPDEGIPFHQR